MRKHGLVNLVLQLLLHLYIRVSSGQDIDENLRIICDENNEDSLLNWQQICPKAEFGGEPGHNAGGQCDLTHGAAYARVVFDEYQFSNAVLENPRLYFQCVMRCYCVVRFPQGGRHQTYTIGPSRKTRPIYLLNPEATDDIPGRRTSPSEHKFYSKGLSSYNILHLPNLPDSWSWQITIESNNAIRCEGSLPTWGVATSLPEGSRSAAPLCVGNQWRESVRIQSLSLPFPFSTHEKTDQTVGIPMSVAFALIGVCTRHSLEAVMLILRMN